MDYDIPTYEVYVTVDASNRITGVNSSGFLEDLTNWTKIDEGIGYKYFHAQNNYFSRGIYTGDHIPRYKLVDDHPVERTEEEIQADREARPTPEPAPTVEELQAKIAALTTSNQMLEDCIIEMAGVIYA